MFVEYYYHYKICLVRVDRIYICHTNISTILKKIMGIVISYLNKCYCVWRTRKYRMIIHMEIVLEVWRLSRGSDLAGWIADNWCGFISHVGFAVIGGYNRCYTGASMYDKRHKRKFARMKVNAGAWQYLWVSTWYVHIISGTPIYIVRLDIWDSRLMNSVFATSESHIGT